ncbi:MAG: PotD/PotF family extracellular solute-binding protein [Alphaproteobacteria bacterium]
MSVELTRRDFIAGAAAGLAATGLSLSPNRAGAATEPLVGIDWGGPLIEATKKIAAEDKGVDITWELHSGGAGTVLPKIKSAWPHPKYDIVAAWNPVFITMINEGWLEPLSEKEMPNLADIPRQFLFTDKAGDIVNVPRSLAGMFWGYREDTAPVKLERIEQLLDPKLKGQICWPGPNINSNLQLLSLALAHGGNEQNMEPGWQFLKALAQSGNIGRVAQTETAFINSMTTGETSVAFWNMSPWKSVAKNFKVKVLTRVAADKGLKTFLYQDGWVVLKSSEHKQAAKEFLNRFVSPENNQTFNEMLGQAPTNAKAKASGFAENIAFTKDEIQQFAYLPDFAALATQLDGSVKRFETEIVPLLK